MGEAQRKKHRGFMSYGQERLWEKKKRAVVIPPTTRYKSNPFMWNPLSITNLAQQREWSVPVRAYSENDVVKHIFQLVFRQRCVVARVVVKVSDK